MYKVPKALASEALVAGQSWVLIKSFTEKVHIKPRFKDSQRVNADYCIRQRVPESRRRTVKGLVNFLQSYATKQDWVFFSEHSVQSNANINKVFLQHLRKHGTILTE